MKAKDMMTSNLITVSEKAKLREVIQLMFENNISGIPIIDEERKLKGIVSESDVIRLKRKIHMPDYMKLLESLLNNANPDDFAADVTRALEMPVKDFMAKKVITATEDTCMAEVTRLMLEHGINRIPIIRNNKPTGIITRRDVIRIMAGFCKQI